MTRLVSRARSNLYTVAVRNSGTNIPLAADRGSGRRDHSETTAIEATLRAGSSTSDPPGLISSWKMAEFDGCSASGDRHDRSLDDNAGVNVFPQRHEQLAGQRHDHCLLQPAVVLLHPLLEP